MLDQNEVKTAAFQTACEVINLHNKLKSSNFPLPEEGTPSRVCDYQFAFVGKLITFILPRDSKFNARYVSVFMVKTETGLLPVRVDLYNDNFTFPNYYLQIDGWKQE